VVSWPHKRYTVTAINACGASKTYISIGAKAIRPTIAHWTGGTHEKLTVAVAMNTSIPGTNGDPITDYQISPALPTGVTLETSTGVITGTPTHVAAVAKEYTLTASNTGGSAHFKQSIAVDAEAPTDLAYDGTKHYVAWTWTLGHAYNEVPHLSASSSVGGASVTYAISPTTLPTGTHFDVTTGIIKGTPTALMTTATNYTVTASNSGGSTTIVVNVRAIAVAPEMEFVPEFHQFTHEKCIAEVDATNHAGPYSATTSCSISPELPEGLVLNRATCAITGCPKVIAWPPQKYVVTASNSGGMSSTPVTVGVRAIAPKTLELTGGKSEVFTWNKTIHEEHSVVNGCIQSHEEPRSVILHWVTSCTQCGINWCESSKWSKNKIGVEGSHHKGEHLTSWGCSRVSSSTIAWRNSASGAIYAIEESTAAASKAACTKTLVSSSMGSSHRSHSFDVGGTVTRLPSSCTKNDHVYISVSGCGEKTTCKIKLDEPRLRDFMQNGHQHGWVPVHSELVEGRFEGLAGCNYMWTGAAGSRWPGWILRGNHGIEYSAGKIAVDEHHSFTTSGWSHSQNFWNHHEGHVHGPFTGSQRVHKTFTVEAHSRLRVYVRYFATDSWDHEWGYMWVNNQLWWRGERTSAWSCRGGSFHWYGPSFPNPWANGYQRCYTDIRVERAHSATSTTIMFGSNNNQWIGDESFSFANLRVYVNSPIETATFASMYTHSNWNYCNGKSGGGKVEIKYSCSAYHDPIVRYHVTPDLPEGLVLDHSTGALSGTPAHVTPEKTYKFTASNTGGPATFEKAITVNAAAPADLSYNGGHTSLTLTLGHHVAKKSSINRASMEGGPRSPSVSTTIFRLVCHSTHRLVSSLAHPALSRLLQSRTPSLPPTAEAAPLSP
jgi:hypothetical protein